MTKTTPTLKQEFFSRLSDENQKNEAEKLLTILSFPDINAGLSEAIKALSPILECLRFILPGHRAIWDAWLEALPALVDAAIKSEIKIAESLCTPSHSKLKAGKRNSVYGPYKDVPLLALIVEEADPDKLPKVLPLKAILFAVQALSAIPNSRDEYFAPHCDKVRLAHGKASPFSMVPAWHAGSDDWALQFYNICQQLGVAYHNNRRGSSYPYESNILYRLGKRYEALLGSVTTTSVPTSQPDITEFSIEDVDGESKFEKIDRLLKITVPLVSNAHVDNLAAAPHQVRAILTADIAADQMPSSVASQQNEVRYTNYRTRSKKQFLPWAWDALNPIEISHLLSAVLNASEEHAKGAALSWLMLFTGLPLKEILGLELAERVSGKSGIDSGGNWHRVIPLLRSAFLPDEKQQKKLEQHTNRVPLMMPMPYPDWLQRNISNLIGDTTIFLSTFFSQESESTSAEAELRNFLESIRISHDGRYSPGRIQKVLATNIMSASGDTVIVHLITGLPTDIPPVGAFYAAFDVNRIISVYQEAITRIFNA
jgi:integrase